MWKNHCITHFFTFVNILRVGGFPPKLFKVDVSQTTLNGVDSFEHILIYPLHSCTSFGGENTLGLEGIPHPLINFVSLVNLHGLHFVGRRYGPNTYHPCILWIFPEKNIGAVHTAAHVRISEVITLGSRQSLCINQSLRSRARGAGHLNDLCRQGIPARWKHRKNMLCFYYIQQTYIYIVYIVSWSAMATQEIAVIFLHTPCCLKWVIWGWRHSSCSTHWIKH